MIKMIIISAMIAMNGVQVANDYNKDKVNEVSQVVELKEYVR